MRVWGVSRRCVFLAAAAAALLFAWVSLQWWLRQPTSRSFLADQLARRLGQALEQPVSIAEVRLGFFPPRVEVGQVQVGPLEDPWLTVEKAAASLARVKLASKSVELNVVAVRGVRVKRAGLGSGGGQGGGGWVRVNVRQLQLQDFHIEGWTLPDGTHLQVKDLQLMWRGEPGKRFQGTVLRAAQVVVEPRGFQSVEGSLAAWGRVLSDRVEIKRFRGLGPGFEADLAGTVSWGGPSHIRGKVLCNLAELDRVLGLGLQLAGDAQAEGQVWWEGAQWSVEADVRAADLSLLSFVFREVEGEAHLSPEGLDASLHRALFAGGQLSGSYALGSWSAPFPHRVAVKGKGLDVNLFLQSLGLGDGGLAARAEMNAEVSWEGEAIGAGRGTAWVTLAAREGEVPAAGELALALRGDGALHFRAPALLLPGGEVSLTGPLELRTLRPHWKVVSPGVNVTSVARLLRGWVGEEVIPSSLTGVAVLDLSLFGPWEDLTVEGKVGLSPVCLGPLEAEGLEGDILVAGGRLQVSQGLLAVGSGRVRFEGSLELARGGLAWRFRGSHLPLARVFRWAGLVLPASGAASFEGTLSGTLEAPELWTQLGFSEVTLAGVVFGSGKATATLHQGVVEVRELEVGPLTGKAHVDFPAQQVTVQANLRGLGLEGVAPQLARLFGGALDCQLEGSFPFASPAGELHVRSTEGASGVVRFTGHSLALEFERPGQWAVSAALFSEGKKFSGNATLKVNDLHAVAGELLGQEVPLGGSLVARAQLRLGGGRPSQIQGALEELLVEVEGQRFGLVRPAEFSVEGEKIELRGLEMAGERTKLFLRGVREASGQLQGNLLAEIPAALLSLVLPQGSPRGQVEVLGEISGTDKTPRFEGVARVVGGAFRLPGLPGPLTGIDGLFELVPEAVSLRDVRFGFLGGTGTAKGQIRLQPAVELDLEVSVSNSRWPVAPGLEPAVTGRLRVAGSPEALTVAGDLGLNRTIYRRDVNLQKLVLEELLRPARLSSQEAAFLSLDLRVAIPGTLEIDTPLAKLAAGGELRIVGNAAQLGLLGRLEALPGGEIFLAGVPYELERGVVTFSNPESIEPTFDVRARGVVENIAVTLGLTGTLDRLVPTLASDPPLPESDIMAIIALGKPSASASPTSASMVASSFLTEQLTSAVTSRTRTLLALDQLRVDPFFTSETGTPTARVTVVKQLSPDWSVTLSTNLASNREEVIQTRYRLSPELYLEATRDTDGSYALEVKWRRRY